MFPDPKNLPRIRQEMDSDLSFLDSRPSLHNQIMQHVRGEKKVKKKISLGLAFTILLVLFGSTVALSSAYRGISYFFEKSPCLPDALDSDYLIPISKQSYESQHLNIAGVDTYWDGVELSTVYRITPADSENIIRINCPYEDCPHYIPINDADILLPESFDNVRITTQEGSEIKVYRKSSDWVYEEDGSVSILLGFPINNMDHGLNISILINYILTDTEEEFESTLRFSLPSLPDPIEPHEHDWLPATCVSQMECSICHRTEGNLGSHVWDVLENEPFFACIVCRGTLSKPETIHPSSVLSPGERSNIVMMLQLRLRELGYFSGYLVGGYDDITTEAVKSFQKDYGIEPTGICNSNTLKLLFP